MELKDVILKRRSVRGYESTPISDATLTSLFNVVRFAPSACNNQPCIFIIVRSKEIKELLGQSYEKKWFKEAPVIIAAVFDTTKAWTRFDGKSFGVVDTAIGLDHLTLAAADVGLGTCWIGAFKEDIARAALNLPKHIELVAMTPLGYPKERVKNDKKRDNTDTFLHWDSFGGTVSNDTSK